MPQQKYLNKTVLQAATERISFIFDAFENIIVSVSGGKDSTVLAHLVLKEAVKRNRRVGLFLLDEEVLYESSVNQVEYLMNLAPDVTKKIWMQIEFNLTNSTSVDESQLICWESGKHKIWMRPKKSFAVQNRMWAINDQTVRNKTKGFGFYDVIENFERCYENTAFLVGLRAAGESPNRWRAVVKNSVRIKNRDIYWATRRGKNVVMYPIYDWNFHDVWKYIWDAQLSYSKIYDFQFKKGYPINQMRVSSLIHERAFKSICDLPEFEPKTYNRILKRIKGISLAQEKGRDAKLFACRKLPKNYNSWIKYRDFLLKTHRDTDRLPIFIKRFAKQRNNEYVARQQVRQLILNDYENNLAIDDKDDPREALIKYYEEVL